MEPGMIPEIKKKTNYGNANLSCWDNSNYKIINI